MVIPKTHFTGAQASMTYICEGEGGKEVGGGIIENQHHMTQCKRW